MKLDVKIDGNLRLSMDEEIRVGKMAATAAVSGIGAAIKGDWRGQIKGAGLGSRLANTVRSEVYPKGGISLNASSMIWSKAKTIVGAFETGVEITAKNGNWLAIPLPAAGKSSRGGRITPLEWERRTGRRLTFVYRRGRTALLIDTGTTLRGARVMGRDGFSRPARGFRNRSVPIFALVPRVRLQKRLGLYASADRLAQSMGARLIAGWRD